MVQEFFVSAVIAAAGQGKRMKSSINKQYLKLKGKPILAYTLEVFDRCKSVDEIIIIVHPNEIHTIREEVLNIYKFNKEIKLVKGGKERQQSIFNGLMAVNHDSKIVVTHDGARPFVTVDIIENSIREALENKAVGVGVPVKDTIKVVGEDGFIRTTLDRSKLWNMQTPQTFLKDVLMEAHLKARQENFLGTDDCVLVERLGYKVKMIEGSYENIKITTPEDLIIGEEIIKKRSNK